jgi:excisionase family DNA binding protein
MGSPTASEIVTAPARSERLWKVGDVAAYLGVSASWVYQHAEKGDLPSLRFAGNLRFEPDAVRAYARGERPAEAKVLTLRAVGGSAP